jgi:uncharacterized integral membrane protein
MNAKIIIAIAAAIFIIIFALQNTVEVSLRFFAWEFSGSLSLFLLVSIILGIVIGSLFTISLRRAIKKQADRREESRIETQTLK